MYSTDEIARFKASADTQSSKLLKQHLFNSARIVELEARVALLESMLNISSGKSLLNIGDVDVESISNTLEFLCTRPIDTWDLQVVEDLSNDVARMGNRLIKKLGERCRVALEVAYTIAASSKDVRAPVASTLAKIQLDRVKTVLG